MKPGIVFARPFLKGRLAPCSDSRAVAYGKPSPAQRPVVPQEPDSYDKCPPNGFIVIQTQYLSHIFKRRASSLQTSPWERP